MKKTLIAGASIMIAGCLLTACGGGDSGTTVKKDLEVRPPATEKIAPPDATIKDSLKSNSTTPPTTK